MCPPHGDKPDKKNGCFINKQQRNRNVQQSVTHRWTGERAKRLAGVRTFPRTQSCIFNLAASAWQSNPHLKSEDRIRTKVTRAFYL